jgi:hypothetical protein
MELETPRAEPHVLDRWTSEIEELLSDWAEISLCYSYLHRYAERKYKRKYHNLQIPIIVLSTLTGTANFATESYIPTNYKQGFSAGVGSLNLLCGVLGTLLSFLRYSEVYESHRLSSLQWQTLGRSIQVELLLAPERRKYARDFLKVSRSTFDNLLENSPTLDQGTIDVFNQRFKSSYTDVARPLVVNGLQKVSVYRPPNETHEDDMASVQTSVIETEQP